MTTTAIRVSLAILAIAVFAAGLLIGQFIAERKWQQAIVANGAAHVKNGELVWHTTPPTFPPSQ